MALTVTCLTPNIEASFSCEKLPEAYMSLISDTFSQVRIALPFASPLTGMPFTNRSLAPAAKAARCLGVAVLRFAASLSLRLHSEDRLRAAWHTRSYHPGDRLRAAWHTFSYHPGGGCFRTSRSFALVSSDMGARLQNPPF